MEVKKKKSAICWTSRTDFKKANILLHWEWDAQVRIYRDSQNLHWVLKWQIWEVNFVLKSEIITSVMQEYKNQMQRLQKDLR